MDQEVGQWAVGGRVDIIRLQNVCGGFWMVYMSEPACGGNGESGRGIGFPGGLLGDDTGGFNVQSSVYRRKSGDGTRS